MTASQDRVPVAFLGRTSTLVLQDPEASLRRQARACAGKLPAGWEITAWFWDVESGGLDLDARGHGTGHHGIDPGIPRDGGMADLLAEAQSPAPRFAAVVCEDIERSARDTFSALQLEKELARQGVPLFATDEPITVEGMNATTVLIRRVKQGVAEWYRLQLKEKVWAGLVEHSLAGWNTGPAPYGYAPERIPHPIPVRAAEGGTKTRLIRDPATAPAVEQIFTWRVNARLGMPAIAARLNADLAAYPAPGPVAGWTTATVRQILANPKYTGHMVFGRRRTINGTTRQMPPDQWLWSAEPTHPALVTRQMWQAAQDITAAHSSSRDEPGLNPHPATRRAYALRSRLRCRTCKRRMTGFAPRPKDVYYLCPHDPANPAHARKNPDHPRRVALREDILLPALQQFLAERLFGPHRAAYLAAQLPATAADDTARREAETAAIKKKLRKVDAAQEALITDLEAPHDPANPADRALRDRIRRRFTQRQAEREELEAQLAALDTRAAATADPALLDALPYLAANFTDAPARLQQQLYAALNLEMVYKPGMHQVSIHATLTDTTPAQLAAIPDLPGTAPGNHDTDPATTDARKDSAHHPR
jgi:site-specific DNA recombinase